MSSGTHCQSSGCRGTFCSSTWGWYSWTCCPWHSRWWSWWSSWRQWEGERWPQQCSWSLPRYLYRLLQPTWVKKFIIPLYPGWKHFNYNVNISFCFLQHTFHLHCVYSITNYHPKVINVEHYLFSQLFLNTFDHFIELNEVDDKLKDIADDEDEHNQGESSRHGQVSSLSAVEWASPAASPANNDFWSTGWLIIKYESSIKWHAMNRWKDLVWCD